MTKIPGVIQGRTLRLLRLDSFRWIQLIRILGEIYFTTPGEIYFTTLVKFISPPLHYLSTPERAQSVPRPFSKSVRVDAFGRALAAALIPAICGN
jgi:hypothetical protein